MSQDIFNRQMNHNGSFSSDNVSIFFGTESAKKDGSPANTGGGEKGAAGAVVQRLAMTYQQPVTRLYELGGGGNFYYVAGRASGEASIDKVLGPVAIIDQFLTHYGNVCEPEQLQIELNSGCKSEDTVAPDTSSSTYGRAFYDCEACVMTSLGVSVQASNTIINQNVRLMIGYVKTVTADNG